MGEYERGTEMEKGNKLDGFSGKIGENIQSTNAEKEEDLLETLYLWWNRGKQITMSEICIHLNITKHEINYLVKQMVKHGYLKEPGKSKVLELTDFGKTQGAECLTRHQYLTQFLQMVCGLDEEQAQEDACRMEHVVSGGVIQGVCEFLKYGNTYDRVAKNLNLDTMYEEGNYIFRMGIYLTEQRYPRVLSEEFYEFSEKICMQIKKDTSYFYLQPITGNYSKKLWYKDEDRWIKAQRTELGFRIPSDIFSFTLSTVVPITEGDGIIAFTAEEEELPSDTKCRELNVHIW